MGHAQKFIAGTQTFPISQLSGCKHTTAFHKLSKTNRHQALKHLRQYWCNGNWSVIGNRRGRWTFRNWSDIGLSPASRETYTDVLQPYCRGLLQSVLQFEWRAQPYWNIRSMTCAALYSLSDVLQPYCSAFCCRVQSSVDVLHDTLGTAFVVTCAKKLK